MAGSGFVTPTSIQFRRNHFTDAVVDRNPVSVAPVQLGKEFLWVHYARLDEAVVAERPLR